MEDWQSLAAPAVVAIVVIVFVARAIRRASSKKSTCGTGCGCVKKPASSKRGK